MLGAWSPIRSRAEARRPGRVVGRFCCAASVLSLQAGCQPRPAPARPAVANLHRRGRWHHAACEQSAPSRSLPLPPGPSRRVLSRATRNEARNGTLGRPRRALRHEAMALDTLLSIGRVGANLLTGKLDGETGRVHVASRQPRAVPSQRCGQGQSRTGDALSATRLLAPCPSLR